MAGTFSNLLYHLIFSTKHRTPSITDQVRQPLYQYIGGIVRAEGGSLIEAGGIEDHVHLLVRLKPVMPVAEAVRLIKSNSSKWLHRDLRVNEFHWQNGYGAFSVSQSAAPEVGRYIRDQKEHHRKRTFKEELLDFLKKHEIDFDERYIWD